MFEFVLLSTHNIEFECLTTHLDKSIEQPDLYTGPVVQLVAIPGSRVQSRPHTFVKIDHEIIFMVILFLLLIQEGLLSVTSESMCMMYELTA